MSNLTLTATEQEAQLIEEFRMNPELFDLFSEVVEVYKDNPKQFKDLHAIETYLLGKVRAIGNNALGRWAESLEREVSVIEQAKPGLCKHSKKKLNFTTLLVKISVEETVFQQGSRYVRPLAKALKVVARGCSVGLQEIIVDFGAEDSFALAYERLHRHHGIELSESKLRKITLSHGQSIYENGKLDTLNGALPGEGSPTIIAEADGTLLPIVEFVGDAADNRKNRVLKWEETKLCAAVKSGEQQAVYGFGESVGDLGLQWAECVKQAGATAQSAVHVVCDGAAWITQQAEQCLGQNTTVTLDFYHACDYLAACAKSPGFADESDWFETRKQWLKQGKSAELIDLLKTHSEPETVADEQAPVRKAHRYFSNRAEQLDYPGALAKNLPIGSGLIEGAHRHVLQKRLKLSGAWWKRNNLKHMVALRITRANKQWDDYWDSVKAA